MAVLVPDGRVRRARYGGPAPAWMATAGLPGCDARCRVVPAVLAGARRPTLLALHDPEAHEAHGWQAALDGSPPLVTGGVVLDVAGLRLVVDGEERHVTATELVILSQLARRPDGYVPHKALGLAIWGESILELPLSTWQDALRTYVSRVRERLAPWQWVLRTQVGIGYGLAVLPPGSDPPSRGAASVRPYDWSKARPACLGCGTTERRHHARGYCRRCSDARAGGLPALPTHGRLTTAPKYLTLTGSGDRR